MKKNIKTILVIIAFLVTVSGCEYIPFLKTSGSSNILPKPKGKIVAKIGDLYISQDDLEKEIKDYNDAMDMLKKPEQKLLTKEQKANYLKTYMIPRMLLYNDALNKGLDKNEEVTQALEKTRRDLLVLEVMRQEVGNTEVTSQEIEDYYNKIKNSRLKDEEERQFREIMVPTEAEARDILIQVLQGADFASLAKEKSRLPTAKDGGNTGLIKKGVKSSQYDSVGFASNLDIGQTSSIFKGPDGYYILKLEAKRGGTVKPLSEVYDELKIEVSSTKQAAKLEELVRNLSGKITVNIYESEID